MKSRSIALTTVLAVFFGVALTADAEPIKVEQIHFAKGASSATVKGSISGDKIVDYKLGAKVGQTMNVKLKTGNTANYFNVLPPGFESALFIGSTSGNEWSGTLPADGEYTVRVYLMRSAARRNEKANCTLTVGIAGGAVPGARPAMQSTESAVGGSVREGGTSNSPLAGSEWPLVEIQSMDDTVGTIRPEDPSRYTMRFNADGTVAIY